MHKWTDWQAELTLSSDCCAGPDSFSSNSGLLKELQSQLKAGHGRPTQMTSPDLGRFHQAGYPRQEFHKSYIERRGVSNPRSLITGSPALYQLSYGTYS